MVTASTTSFLWSSVQKVNICIYLYFGAVISRTGAGAINLTHNVGAASLVASEGSEVDGLLRIVLRELSYSSSMVLAALARQETKGAVSGALKLTVRHAVLEERNVRGNGSETHYLLTADTNTMQYTHKEAIHGTEINRFNRIKSLEGRDKSDNHNLPTELAKHAETKEAQHVLASNKVIICRL